MKMDRVFLSPPNMSGKEQEYIKKVKNGEKIKKRNIVLEFEENEIYEYLDDVNIRNVIQDTLDNICLIEIEMKTIKDYKIRNV